MLHRHVLFKLAAAHPHKGHPVAVARIHVGLQLEHKAAETGADRIDLTGIAGAAHRLLGQLQKGIKKRPHAEVGHRRTKENRRELTGVHQL